MNHIQTTTPETPSDSYVVEFYPSTDDYVYISTRVSQTVPTPVPIKFFYQGFLLINAVGFPAFLWLNEYLIAGIFVLGLNIAALSWLIPWFNDRFLRQYYEHVMGPREKEVARVELTSEGIRYTSDDGDAFWPWRRITAMEENDDAIFFFFAGNGFAIRKSGFAYRDAETAFSNFARQQLELAHSRVLEQ